MMMMMINDQKPYSTKHSFYHTTITCLTPVCFAHFCCKSLCQFTHFEICALLFSV
jgi:hypothetical protein